MSDYKTILLHCDAGKAMPARLDIGFDLGAQFGARVACLSAFSELRHVNYGYRATEIVQEAQRKILAGMRAAARRAYDDALRRKGFEAAEWRESAADALDAVALHARYADLVVIGQQDPDEASGVSGDFESSLPLAAGRPVLVVPYAFEHRPVGRHVLVAWNASREAARAVTDALPLLKRAGQVHVVSFRPEISAEAHGEEPGADIALYLARHGVKVTVSQHDAPAVDIGNQLLSRAFDLSADLIVMGAWGHSRMREFVLGGVTRTLLETMTVPVLMCH